MLKHFGCEILTFLLSTKIRGLCISLVSYLVSLEIFRTSAVGRAHLLTPPDTAHALAGGKDCPLIAVEPNQVLLSNELL